MVTTNVSVETYIDRIAEDLSKNLNYLVGSGILYSDWGFYIFFLNYTRFINNKYEDLIEEVYNNTNYYINQLPSKKFNIKKTVHNEILGWSFFQNYILKNKYNSEYVPTEIFDEFMYDMLLKNIGEKNLDGDSGLVVPLLYFLNLTEFSDKYIEPLGLAVNCLAESITESQKGGFWYTNFKANVRPNEKKVFLGLPGGNAFFTLLLVKLYEANICSNICKTLIDKSCRFLQNNKIDFEKNKCSFPLVIFPESSSTDIWKSSNWLCSGDIGIIYTLTRASKIVPRSISNKYLDSLLIENSSRSFGITSDVNDVNILYGAGGTALCLKAINSLRNDSLSQDLCNKWFSDIEQRLTYFIDQDGQYKSKFNQHYVYTNFSLAEGAAGIGLVLMEMLGHETKINNMIWLM